jgi:hypothetical protein
MGKEIGRNDQNWRALIKRLNAPELNSGSFNPFALFTHPLYELDPFIKSACAILLYAYLPILLNPNSLIKMSSDFDRCFAAAEGCADENVQKD